LVNFIFNIFRLFRISSLFTRSIFYIIFIYVVLLAHVYVYLNVNHYIYHLYSDIYTFLYIEFKYFRSWLHSLSQYSMRFCVNMDYCYLTL
jgi:hypothetical protein